MTATNDEPDPLITEDRWQHIEDRLAAIERRIREHSSDAIATVDACLARLDALRHDLAHGRRGRRAGHAAFASSGSQPGSHPRPAQTRVLRAHQSVQ
ncbi:hypothetical protein [Kitasatospora sp. NPDC006786]|uniref:hypothetical protein n=1 Tax=unclassified Kitasatospora TaxID=2633591 RepID=UPI00337A05F9